MNHLMKMANGFMNTISLRTKDREEPEPLYKERPMTGILDTMSRDEIDAAFAYNGSITTGSSHCLK